MGRKGVSSTGRGNLLATAQSSLAGGEAPVAFSSGTVGNSGVLPEGVAVIQQIALIVASTLDIDQVYERFAAEVKKLLDFDRISVSVVDRHAGTFTTAYLFGIHWAGREVGTVVPLAGTLTERTLQTGQPCLRQDFRNGESFFGDEVRLKAGMRSSLMVPLRSESGIVGTLQVLSRRVGAFGPPEQAILEQLADQIAPAVENARLYESLQETHHELESRVEAGTRENALLSEELRVGTEEKTVIGEVARIVTSTLDIDQVYERFAAEVKKLVDFDRLTVTTIDREARTFSPTYASGVKVEGRELGKVVPLAGTVVEQMLKTGRTFSREDLRTDNRFKHDSVRFDARLRSQILVPLVVHGQVLGNMSLTSRQAAAYGPQEQALLELLADQIAPAVENARLYQELQTRTEEKAVIDEVARIVTSTLDIDQVYERFASEVKKLVDFERIAINIFDREAGTFRSMYMSGVHRGGRAVDNLVPFEGSKGQLVMKTGHSLLRPDIQAERTLSADPDRLQAGLRSDLTVPLFSKGAIIGVMGVHGCKAGTYGPKDQAILERLAHQIAPAVENARLHQELRASTEQQAVIDELARIVTSTLDIDQVYEKFATEVKRLVDFDRLVINAIDLESKTIQQTNSFGISYENQTSKRTVPLEGTTTHRVLQTGQPFFWEDTGSGDEFSNSRARMKAGIRGSMTVPLFSKGRIHGTLNVLSCRLGAYGPKAQAILERLADQIAPAVENSRLYADLQKAHDELESRVEARTAENDKLYRELEASTRERAGVDKVARIVTSTLDIDEVYEKFATEVKRLVDFDRLVLNSVGQEANNMEQTCWSGVAYDGHIAREIGSIAGSLIQPAPKTGWPFPGEDVQTGRPLSSDSAPPNLDIRCRLAAPLLSKGRITGTLAVHSQRVAAYGPRDQAILDRLADQIAPAVENARLYESLRASTEQQAVVDEIAMIITSTLDIDEVYEKFAAEVRELLDFDRIGISILDREAGTFSPTYVSGVQYAGREIHAVVPIEGTLVERLLRRGTAIMRDDIRSADIFSGDPARIGAGLRSELMVPLFCSGQITGTLHVYSLRVGAYGPKEQALLERLADQIAPAVENARLYEALQASIEQQAVVSEVSRIITSTLEIDQVYERFAAEVKELLDFDRIGISVINDEAGTYIPTYLSGVGVAGREANSVVYLGGTIVEQVLQTGRPILRDDMRTGGDLPGDPARVEAGLCSYLSVPMVSKGRVSGTLGVYSARAGAYGPREEAILERLADQIAPAVENSRLYESLRASTKEKAVVDEISNIITSTVNIDQVYEKFAGELKKLVDFDRIAISAINEEAGTFRPTYIGGIHFSESELHATFLLEGTMVERILRTGTPFMREDINSEDGIPGDPARIRAGLRSELMVPLYCKGQITGTLRVYSSGVRAYGLKEQAILERLANQIGPVVENARLDELLRASTGQQAVVQEIARIITSTLDIDQVYDRFAGEVKEILDRQRQWDSNEDKGSRGSDGGGSS